MANQLLLVNPTKPPSRRKKRSTKSSPKRGNMMAKQRRSAKQQAATRKLVAFNKRRRSPTKAKRRRRRNPVAPRRAAAYRATPLANPPARRKRRAPMARRRRRNPVRTRGFQGAMNNYVMPAIPAAGGALALDIVWAYLPIPPNLKVGPMRHLAKGAGAIGIAMLAEMVVTRKTADAMGLGAMTVVMYNAGREMLSQMAPQIPMEGLGYYNPGMPAGSYQPVNNAVNNSGTGEYVGEYVGEAYY